MSNTMRTHDDSQLGSERDDSTVLHASAPNVAEPRAILNAVSDGLTASQRKSWADLWSAYARLRVAFGESPELPRGSVSEVAVLARGGGQAERPNYHAIAFDVFVWLARNEDGLPVADRIMRGALRARIAELAAHCDALASPNRATSDVNPLLVSWRVELAQMRRTFSGITTDTPHITINGQEYDVEIDERRMRTTAQCPVDRRETEWAYEVRGFQNEDRFAVCVPCGREWRIKGDL